MRTIVTTALVLCGVILAGCTTTGTGVGHVDKGGSGPVTFYWKSADGGMSGTMSASLAPGRSLSGKFFQITSDTELDGLTPLWDGWEYGWNDWGQGAEGEFDTYSDRVLANLTDAKGEHMRCRFRLTDPNAGMSGGGSGECQVQGGEKIDAIFQAG